MNWQDWTVAAIGAVLVVWLAWRVINRLRSGGDSSPCCGCGCADSCPSARNEQKCPSDNSK